MPTGFVFDATGLKYPQARPPEGTSRLENRSQNTHSWNRDWLLLAWWCGPGESKYFLQLRCGRLVWLALGYRRTIKSVDKEECCTILAPRMSHLNSLEYLCHIEGLNSSHRPLPINQRCWPLPPLTRGPRKKINLFIFWANNSFWMNHLRKVTTQRLNAKRVGVLDSKWVIWYSKAGPWTLLQIFPTIECYIKPLWSTIINTNKIIGTYA